MTIEKTFQGAWRVSGMVNGYLITRQFFGHTRKEALAAFKEATQ